MGREQSDSFNMEEPKESREKEFLGEFVFGLNG